MVSMVNLGGADRPVSFGFAAMIKFGKISGRELKEISEIAEFDLEEIIQLSWAGLSDGARRKNQAFEHTLEDVCDWLDEQPDMMITLMQMFAEAQVQPGAKKKETKPQKKKN